MVRDSRVDLASGEFPKQLDISNITVYGLSILFVGIVLFLTFINLLHPSFWHGWMQQIHGFGTLVLTVVTVCTRHLTFTVVQRVSQVLAQKHTLGFWSSFMAILGVANFKYELGLCKDEAVLFWGFPK